MGYIGQAPTKVPLDAAGITDGSVGLSEMASQSVDEDNLYISNSGSNGQFLSKQSGDTGGLTWAGAGVSGLTNNSNTTWMTVSADEEVNMPLQPCFHAYLSAGVNDITGDGTNYTVVWDAERFDQGGDFASNTFTAPISGRYLLSFHFSTSTGIDTSVDTVATYIVTSDVTFTTLMSDTNDMGYVRHSSIAVVCNMDAADTATTAVQIVGGAATVDLEATGYTHFSGCLIA